MSLLEAHLQGLKLEPGQRLGRYVIVRLLGEGGMGSVYEATHTELKKRVALKTLHPLMSLDGDDHQRFIREGQAASRIRHPNAVDVSDFGVEDGVPYLVMEYLDGVTLASLIENSGRLDIPRVVELLVPVCAAVFAAHQEGIVHRDLKPANIFLARTRDGETVPKVLDFGISKMESDSAQPLTGTDNLLGTPQYMSPEQVQSARRVDVRSDQYALGVILYECATGCRPFDGESSFSVMHAIVNGEFVPPRARCPDLPVVFEAVILRAMARAPENRFESVATLARALAACSPSSASTRWTFAATSTVPDQALSSATPRGDIENLDSLSSVQRRARPGVPLSRAVGAMAVAALGVVAVIGGVTLSTRPRTVSPVRPSPPYTARVVPARTTEPTGAVIVAVEAEPRDAAIYLDGVLSGRGSIHTIVPRGGAEHHLRVEAPEFVPFELRFRDVAPPERVRLSPRATEAAAARPDAPSRATLVRAPGPPRARVRREQVTRAGLTGTNAMPIVE